MTADTIDYYENNAWAFVESTIAVDMRPLYRHFLPLLPWPADILDVGCGSGRDSRYFARQGHRVTAIDPSSRIADLAENVINQDVTIQRVQDISYHHEFDGIWASASLLHVPANELQAVFYRLAEALKAGGVLYCSFKYGRGEHWRSGRRFTDLDESGLQQLVESNNRLSIAELWVSTDRRPGRNDERWLNAVLRTGPVLQPSQDDAAVAADQIGQ
jgi:SAM-dependent methyltransferase